LTYLERQKSYGPDKLCREEAEEAEEARGSQEPVIAHLVFNLTSKVDRKWGVTHNFESGPPRDHFHSNF
jgi:hypothetical protein